MLARTSGGSVRSRSNGPPGRTRSIKKVSVVTTQRTATPNAVRRSRNGIMRSRRSPYESASGVLGAHGRRRAVGLLHSDVFQNEPSHRAVLQPDETRIEQRAFDANEQRHDRDIG